jgi:dihydroxyacetone kinase
MAAPAKKILDTPSGAALVEELLDATLITQPAFVRLDGFSDSTKVLLRRDYEALKASGKVAIVSGGGSGHEPAMAGFVGEGLLTAGVCGDVFASPTIKAVLAAILAVSGSGGCLLIVMNYTGDRINFGIAAEEAKLQYGLRVEMVIVGDDVALKGPKVHPRGIAGTVLVHKAAGALAASGADLAAVAAGASSVAAGVKSMGAAFTACTLPGQPPASRLTPAEIEIGLGIHGEPGAFKSTLLSATEVVNKLFEFVCEAGKFGQGSSCVLLVNNLGSATPMEMTLATAAAVRACASRGITLKGIASGTLMTSLDMLGVSISMLAVDDATLSLLNAPTSAPAWVPTNRRPRVGRRRSMRRRRSSRVPSPRHVTP